MYLIPSDQPAKTQKYKNFTPCTNCYPPFCLPPDGSQKTAWVVYSLGNFISNQRQPNTDGGILFQVELVKHKGSAQVYVGRLDSVSL